MDDVRLIDSREFHKRLSSLLERWYRAKKLGIAQGLAMAIEEVCNTDTIDPIRAAGGCRCGACKWYMTGGVCGWTSSDTTKNLREEDDFCSDGEAREAQDDG